MTAPTIASHRRRPQRRPAVPAYRLYGESGGAAEAGSEMLHVEALQSRSRLYRWEIAAHVHRGLVQVVWVGAGPVDLQLDERRARCEGPAAVVIAPGAVHAFRFSPATQGYVLTTNPASVVEGDAPNAARALQTVFAASRLMPLDAGSADARHLNGLFALMLDEFNAPGAAGGPAPLWLARAAIWRLAQRVLRDADADESAQARPHRGLFARFLALVEAHYLEHRPITRYASQLGLSAERLNRLVRSEVGRNALDVVHERLTREACRRLVYIEAPVSKLAYELGFADAAYFCRFFKRRTGLAPSAYRRRHEAGT